MKTTQDIIEDLVLSVVQDEKALDNISRNLFTAKPVNLNIRNKDTGLDILNIKVDTEGYIDVVTYFINYLTERILTNKELIQNLKSRYRIRKGRKIIEGTGEAPAGAEYFTGKCDMKEKDIFEGDSVKNQFGKKYSIVRINNKFMMHDGEDYFPIHTKVIII